MADDETPVEEEEPEAEPLPPEGDEDEGELEPELESEQWSAGEDAFSVEGLMEALNKVKVSELLLSTVSTLASLAYGKLEAPDLPEAKAAIDAIGAILPLLEGQIDDAGMLRDFGQALTNLRLAYADAVAQAQ